MILDKILKEIEIQKEKCLNVVKIEVDPMEIAIHREQYKGLRMAEDVIRKHMKTDGWIPVEERLPEKGERVIVCTEHGFRCEAIMMESGKYFRYGVESAEIFGQKITAWMPLPEPYRPETESDKHGM